MWQSENPSPRMRWALCACALLALLACAPRAPELSAAGASPVSDDAEYRRALATSEELREADQSIRETLAEAARLLPEKEYRRLLAREEAWKQQEFLANVRAYEETGLSEVQAWAMEVGNHADSLGMELEIARLRLHAQGHEGVYQSRRRANGVTCTGTLLLREEEGEYSVNLLVEQVGVVPPAQCAFSGAASLQGTTLTVQTEDAGAPVLTITLDGNNARVTAGPAANAECDAPLRLDGVYTRSAP